MPMMECTAMESDSPMSDQVKQMMEAAQQNPQIPAAGHEADGGKICRPSGYDLGSGGDSYVKEAYQDLGMNMDHIQLQYLFTTGAKMLALAFCGMGISILVGLLASRVGASCRPGSEKQSVPKSGWIFQQ